MESLNAEKRAKGREEKGQKRKMKADTKERGSHTLVQAVCCEFVEIAGNMRSIAC